MKTSEILSLDYYKADNENIFQKALRNIKPFSKYSLEENVPLEMLEKFIAKCEYKYNIMVNYITPVYIPDERNIYSATIRNTETFKVYKLIFASSLYELYVKLCIYYYSEIRRDVLTLKDWSKRNTRLNEYLKGRIKF